MKLLLSALLITSSTAFLHSAQLRFGNALQLERGESSRKPSAASDSSKLYAASRIAKVAWDIIEEINAHDSSVAKRKSNAKTLQHNIKIHKFNPTLERAVDKAEIATEWWGKKSSKAKLAWEEVEDIATHDMSEVMKGAINEGVESLTKPLETSTAMKELERVLFVAKKAKQNQ